jgi:excisionase family DNA binding protein
VEAMLCGVSDAAKVLGLGRSKIYDLIAEGKLQTVTIGRRRLVRVASIKALAGSEGAQA